MSGTVTPPSPPPEPPWAKPAVGTYGLAAFATGMILSAWLAWSKGTFTALDLCIGAAIGMAKDVIGYYFGSSAGSDRKTELLVTQPSKPGPTP